MSDVVWCGVGEEGTRAFALMLHIPKRWSKIDDF